MSRENNKNKEILGFKTEVKELLNIMINSLYSNKEIFIRELISNASDASDKLRFEAISNPTLLENINLKIRIYNKNNTLIVEDTGIGMTRDEVISNLGTIAKSGTTDFLKKLSLNKQKDSNLIGKFGVGFYSAFIVADKVDVFTRRAGINAEESVHWSSDGKGTFEVSLIKKQEIGTTVIVHLKQGEEAFSDMFRIRNIIKKYSDHISIPIEILKEHEKKEEQEKSIEDKQNWEIINKAVALWTRNKSEITETEYQEFYKYIAHDFEPPLIWSHNKVEGKLEYISLLYIPSSSSFDIYNRESTNNGLKLYIKRIFIMEKINDLLPVYLRFIKGIVDSNDLPLNISREILQKDPITESIKSALTKRVLDMLEQLANNKEKYKIFWKNFGQVLKEGLAEDFINKEKITNLFLFTSTKSENEEQNFGLNDYINRMTTDKDNIYYITGESYSQLKNSPHLEIFKKNNIEVLILTDYIDNWLMNYLLEFYDKKFINIKNNDLSLKKMSLEENDQQEINKNETFIKKLKEILKDKVHEIKISNRLTDSPSMLVNQKKDIDPQMRKILEARGQTLPISKPVLEINIKHPLIQKIHKELDTQMFNDLANILFDQSVIASGDSLQNPSEYIFRLNSILINL